MQKRTSALMKTARGGILLAILFSSATCFHLKDYSAHYSRPDLHILPADILAVAYEKEVYRSASNGSSQMDGAANALQLLAFLSLFTIPAPTDWRKIRQPELWSPTETIEDKPIGLVHNRFNSLVLKNGIDIKDEELVGKSVRGLIALARQKHKKYLFIVRYNMYRQYSESAGNNATIIYSGYIPAASRVLIDVSTGETVFIRAREGEAYFFAFPWVNGYWTDPDLWKFHGRPFNAQAYVQELGSIEYEGALNRMSKYILLTDLLPFLNMNDRIPSSPMPNSNRER